MNPRNVQRVAFTVGFMALVVAFVLGYISLATGLDDRYAGLTGLLAFVSAVIGVAAAIGEDIV